MRRAMAHNVLVQIYEEQRLEPVDNYVLSMYH